MKSMGYQDKGTFSKHIGGQAESSSESESEIQSKRLSKQKRKKLARNFKPTPKDN
jgi:hypothetical protein